MYKGQWMTAREIAPLAGLSVSTVRKRMSMGLPVVSERRANMSKLIEFKGKMLTAKEIARRLGRSVGYVYHRIDNGLPLEGELKRGRKPKDILESGVNRIQGTAGDNGKYWEDDLEVRVWHMYCGGDDFDALTLQEIADLWDISREAVRLVETRAMNKIRALAERGNTDAVNMIAWFEMRSEARAQQKFDHWEQASLNAPGHFDLSDFRNNTSYVDIARKFGHAEYETQPHVVASHAAAERRRRRSA